MLDLMTQHQDTRLTMKHYRATLEGVETQFALIRFALGALSKNAIKGFFKGRLHHQLDVLSRAFQNLKAKAQGDELEEWKEMEDMQREFAKKKHRKESKPADTRFKIEFSEDRLNQSELLLLVAHFESFMKEIHRKLPAAASGKILNKDDKKSVLRSLSERLGISFDKEIGDLKDITDTRNKIAHEIYSSPPRSLGQIKSQPLVSDQMLKKARRLFMEIPRRCIEAGAKTYQSYFRYP